MKTEVEKLARKITKSIFDELKKKSSEQNTTVEIMQMRLQLANFQKIDGVVKFTHFFNTSKYRNSEWQDFTRLWYNRSFTRNEIYHSIIHLLKQREMEN